MSIDATHVDATVGVDGPRPALRVGLGRLTVDILPTSLADCGIPAIVGTGELGEPPVSGEIGSAALLFLLCAADLARERRLIDTAAWPLV